VRGILGIGNPGISYQRNRHNAGFLILNSFAEKKSVEYKPGNGEYYIACGKGKQDSFCLIKPTTFVNNSGIAANQFIEKYRIQLNDFLVVCDDVNLQTGKLRLRLGGGDGGHNGLASIIYHFNSNKFPRLRIGVGNDFTDGQLSSYVLTDFSDDEKKLLSEVNKKSNILINEFIERGIEAMMIVNSKLFNDHSSTQTN
jgi:peptidyl-tRNA hydrolase, PTH1 family